MAPPRKAAFLDRDGTLVHDPGYLGDPERVRLLPAASAAVARLHAAGFVVVVVTNQSGVARGYFDAAAVAAVNERIAELLLEADPEAKIDAFYVCPHGPPATGAPGCACRKPLPGLFLRAAEELGLDLAASIGIGDSERDVAAALAAGCARAERIGPGAHADLASAVRALLEAP